MTRFGATSSPNPIPYLDFLDSTNDPPAITNKGILIFARLEPLLDRATAAEALASAMEGRITKQSQGRMSQLPPEVQHLAIQSAKGWAQARHPKKKEAFQKYLDSDPAAFNAITKVVYKSDIVAVPEAIGSATRVRRKFQRGHSTVTPQLL